jgi:hypothetical protein
MTRRRVVSWVLWGALVIHAPIALVAVAQSRLRQADFDNYYEIGTRPGRPYVDFAVEFPVGTTAAFRALAPLAGSRPRFGVAIVAINIAADAAIVAALAWAWGLEAAACYALVAAPILDLYLLRLDLWSTVLATIGVAAWKRQRPVLAAAGFAAGAAFKLWPLAFLPLLFVQSRRDRRLGIVTAIGAGSAVLGAWLWIAGPLGLYQVLTFRGARGWEVESAVGAAWMLFDPATLRLESGAWRIGTTIGSVSILLFAVGGLPCLWMIWRGGRRQRVGAGWAGGISALLVCSALLSAQFACWISPAAGVAWEEGDRTIALLTAMAVFLTNLVWKSFTPLLRAEPGALTIVMARNVLLVTLTIGTARSLARRSRELPRP